MSEPTIYTAADIERYHRGEMTPAEMHRLEAAALDDPMLADALDGYRQTSTASSDLLLLQEKLSQRIAGKEEEKASVFRLPWLRIAALFLLVAGGAWLIFQSTSDKSAELAKTGGSRRESATVGPIDSSSPLVQTPPSTFTVDSNAEKKDVAVTNTYSRMKNQPELATTPAPHSKNENGHSAGAASLHKAEEQAVTNTAAAARTEPVATPSLPTGDDTTTMGLEMKKEDAHLNEVVVTSATAKRRQANLLVEDAIPVDGWPAFDAYLTDNRKAPSEEKLKQKISGSVELTFAVNSKGNPERIQVRKSLCATCDAEAIRLLKEGPKWTGKNGAVNISFPH